MLDLSPFETLIARKEAIEYHMEHGEIDAEERKHFNKRLDEYDKAARILEERWAEWEMNYEK